MVATHPPAVSLQALPVRYLLAAMAVLCLAACGTASTASKHTAEVTADGTIVTGNGVLPVSKLLSPEAQESMREELKGGAASVYGSEMQACMIDKDWSSAADVAAARHCVLELWSMPDFIESLRGRYPPVDIRTTRIGGIAVDVVTPANGPAGRNRERVLLYLHFSGAFLDAPALRRWQAIPVAGLGRIKVVGVDYTMMPHGTHFDALRDVTRVYSTLLDEYRPENIGIFGCSQGAIITASMIPWLSRQQLPGPGAVALAGEAGRRDVGDSVYYNAAFGPAPITEPIRPDFVFRRGLSYYEGIDPQDVVVQPTRHAEALKLFPPTIVLNSMRDATVSAAVADHRALLRNGVEAELHIWEGLPHCFANWFHGIPETAEYYEQLLRFFDKHLGVESRSD